jgi:hypothetical protein
VRGRHVCTCTLWIGVVGFESWIVHVGTKEKKYQIYQEVMIESEDYQEDDDGTWERVGLRGYWRRRGYEKLSSNQRKQFWWIKATPKVRWGCVREGGTKTAGPCGLTEKIKHGGGSRCRTGRRWGRSCNLRWLRLEVWAVVTGSRLWDCWCWIFAEWLNGLKLALVTRGGCFWL